MTTTQTMNPKLDLIVTVFHNDTREPGHEYLFDEYVEGHKLTHVFTCEIDWELPEMPLVKHLSESVIVEYLFCLFNGHPPLGDDNGYALAVDYYRNNRSLSVGDVLAIAEGDDVTYWAIRRFGSCQIAEPKF